MAIRFERNDLYGRVWRTPIGTLSRKLGVSTAILRDVCKTLAVPMPTVSYWRKIRAGDPMDQTPLPPHEGLTELAIGDSPIVHQVIVNTPVEASSPIPVHLTKSLAKALPPPRLLPLRVWAQMVFGDYAPHVNTLRRWVNEGRIYPQPKKVGKNWYVKPDSEYMGD